MLNAGRSACQFSVMNELISNLKWTVSLNEWIYINTFCPLDGDPGNCIFLHSLLLNSPIPTTPSTLSSSLRLCRRRPYIHYPVGGSAAKPFVRSRSGPPFFVVASRVPLSPPFLTLILPANVATP